MKVCLHFAKDSRRNKWQSSAQTTVTCSKQRWLWRETASSPRENFLGNSSIWTLSVWSGFWATSLQHFWPECAFAPKIWPQQGQSLSCFPFNSAAAGGYQHCNREKKTHALTWSLSSPWIQPVKIPSCYSSDAVCRHWWDNSLIFCVQEATRLYFSFADARFLSDSSLRC